MPSTSPGAPHPLDAHTRDLLLLDRSVALDPVKTAELMQAAGDASDFLKNARSEGTRKAYGTAWTQFETWIQSHGLDALPADPRMVALWIGHMAAGLRRKPATIRRMLATISSIHKRAGHQSPCDHVIVREEMRGISNTLGVRPKRAAPMLIAHLEALVGGMGTNLRALRDRAILLTGWSGALRRSEIAAMQAEDLAFMDKGVRVLIRKSKTDQAGEGQHVGLFYATRTALCPVRALQAWMQAAGIERGPVFVRLSNHQKDPRLILDQINGDTVNYIVKTWTARAAVQPEQIGEAFSAHSLRAGFITEAARAGKAEWSIQKQSRHKSANVLRTYIRIADTFQGNAGEGLL